MDRPNVIQLGGEPPAWLEPALREQHGIRPLPGVVVVEMDEPRHKQGSLYLPDELQGKFRADSGTVIAVADNVPLVPGDRVLVSPYDGKWMTGFRSGGYRSNGEVRIYGRVALPGEAARVVPWTRSVRAVTSVEAEGIRIRPTGKNVLIRRETLHETMGGIMLTDEERYREPIATVLSVGPDCESGLTEGDRVIYLNGACKKAILADLEFGTDAEKNLALICEDGILTRIDA